MEPRIDLISQKKLIGHAIDMSLMNNKTFALFSGFMPNKNLILNSVSTDIYEVMVYHKLHFKNFNPSAPFKKWATVEVSEFEDIPEGMETLTLDEGLYAVFQFKGLPIEFGVLMNFILTKWLPQSKYQLDDRPHFNILGDSYKKNHPDSEEEVFIPIKEKI